MVKFARQWIVLSLATALLVGACATTRQAGDVTISELFRRAKELDGKRVAVIGYYVSGIEESSLYENPAGQHEFPIEGVFSRSMWVDGGSDRFSDHYVRAVGVFHYRPKFRRQILTRDDGRKYESVEPLGYGHLGLSPAELSNVSSFQVLR